MNVELGSLPTRRRRDAIVAAADEVLAGQHDDEFPLVGVADRQRHADEHERQRGAGQPRQRAARRRARREARKVHPNDDVNKGQRPTTSSPPRCAWPPCEAHGASVLPALDGAARHARDEGRRPSRDIVKIGRTHLQDATPLTLGQEFSRLRRAAGARAPAHVERRCRTCTSWRSAAPRSAPGSTRPGLRASGWPTELARAHRPAVRAPRPTSSRRWPANDALVHAHGALKRPGRRAVQDRQRRPLAGLRAALAAWAR